MKKLELNVKKKYFDLILSGEKKEEYRIVKPYWTKRLINKQYDSIVFKNGYSKNAPKIEVEYLGWEIRNIKHEFFGDEFISVFVLKLGKILKNN